jgi:alpha-D-ribose 1-methylphosphonate 5-triphosphate synthase subunit PhnG
MKHPKEGAEWARIVVAPLAEAQTEARRKVAGEAAATRVDFFTLATMRS